MVIWPDKVVSPRDFRDLESGYLRVAKIFHTIQGEGHFAGMPATFVRLAGCNYGSKAGFLCHFCDANFAFDSSSVMHVSEIEQEIRRVSNISVPNDRLVVITGGEPFIQDNVIDLIQFLSDNGYRVQIESNGSRLPNQFHNKSMVDGLRYKYYLVVSPKVVRDKYFMPNPKLIELTDSFKFLVSGDENSLYYNPPPYFDRLVREYSDISYFFSPIAYYKSEPQEGDKPVSIISENSSKYWDLDKTRASHIRAYQIVTDLGRKYPDIDIRLSVQQQIYIGAE